MNVHTMMATLYRSIDRVSPATRAGAGWRLRASPLRAWGAAAGLTRAYGTHFGTTVFNGQMDVTTRM